MDFINDIMKNRARSIAEQRDELIVGGQIHETKA